MAPTPPEPWAPPSTTAGSTRPTFPPPLGPPPGSTAIGPTPPGWTVAAPRPSARAVPVAGPAERRVLRVELAVMAFAAAAPGLVIGLRGLGDPTAIDTEDVGVVEIVAVLLAALGPAAIATYLLWRDRRLAVAGFGRRSPGFVFGYGMLGVATAVGALTAVGLVIGVLWSVFGGDGDVGGDGPDVSLTVGSLAVAVALSAVAGVSEEIVYRAYGITRLEEMGWPRAALVVPWALWSLQHLYAGLLAPLVVGTVGATWVWLFRLKRSIWPLIFAHAVYDIGVFVLVAATAEG